MGCHNTHRMSALREVGGFAPHDADDLLLTLLYQIRGWEGVYVPEVLAQGLAPVEWASFLNQQRRWARSLLDIKLNIAPTLVHKLSFSSQLMNALHGFLYLHKAFILPHHLPSHCGDVSEGKNPRDNEYRNVGDLGALTCHSAILRAVPATVLFGPKTGTRGTLASLALTVCQMAISHHGLFGCHVGSPVLICDHIKNSRATRTSLALWPHILTLLVIGLAWLIGLSLHETIPLGVQFCAGTVIIGTVALMATEWFGVSRAVSKR